MKSHFQIHGNYEKLKDSMPAVAFAMLGHSPESIVEGLFGGGWGLCGWVRSLCDFRGIPQGISPGDTAEDIWYTLLYPPGLQSLLKSNILLFGIWFVRYTRIAVAVGHTPRSLVEGLLGGSWGL